MKKILLILMILTISLSAQHRELIPLSKTKFLSIDKNGREKRVDMSGRDFILISVREEESDGRFYAIDRDGTVWLSGGISSGEEIGYTPSGVWSVLRKIRYYTSKKYPEPDGSNNMDFSLFFTNAGHAIHKGSIDFSSHGCIHVDEKNISRLYSWAWVGMPVLVTRNRYMKYARPDLTLIYKDEKRYRRKRRVRNIHRASGGFKN
jgi:hypothetical protein